MMKPKALLAFPVLLAVGALAASLVATASGMVGKSTPDYYVRQSEIDQGAQKCRRHNGLSGLGVTTSMREVSYHAHCEDGQIIVWPK